MTRLILTLSFILATMAANAADTPKSSVAIHTAGCDGKVSSPAIASLKEQISTSPKYRLVPDLTDEGRMGVVLTIIMACTDRPDVAAVATTYGKAKCFPGAYCHQAVDGSSLKSALCDSSAPTDCGRSLFKTFDDYTSNPNGVKLQLQ